ncbi:hypothetical protein B1C78_13350 [Thioalkalivibrio denitrificans]|uniref:histidine kinase n=1 Tax=Thioalkalivibrio denitrificans TaxID=108003 RepID=A0A1V3NDE9_9GAMM|nr:ATP-binding protein [Thioalkalivibrio denitrificans]OOG22898.1 hypothetical protein B1C78_13350 [Thioalkalivibrio denitrificans]
MGWNRLSLLSRFHLLSGAMVISGMMIIGGWLGHQGENLVVERKANLTGRYVATVVAPYLEELQSRQTLTMGAQRSLDDFFRQMPFEDTLAVAKVWTPDGRIAYSTNPTLVGTVPPASQSLRSALEGSVAARISNLSDPENQAEAERWTNLLEIYVPMRRGGDGSIYAVTELYLKTDELNAALASMRTQGWLLIAGASLLMYLLLLGMVRNATRTIRQQRDLLSTSLRDKRALLADNEKMRERIRNAGSRFITLKERWLQQLSTDLHDGPAQDVSCALLYMDAIGETCRSCELRAGKGHEVGTAIGSVETALTSALGELRGICKGIRSIDLTGFTIGETVEHAINEHKRRCGQKAELECKVGAVDAPESVKVSIYRIVQEALTNGFRHARGARQHVRVGMNDGWISLEITDDGQGLPTQNPSSRKGGLGVAGMRGRAELLGGTFEFARRKEGGTSIRATLPMDISE